MKKINSVIGSASAQLIHGLSQAEMEHEQDHCPAPWKCPDACYVDCAGCLTKIIRR